MSKPSEFSRPLLKMTAMMQARMNEPENVAKSSWLGPIKTVETLQQDVSRNFVKMQIAANEGRIDEVWRRAANAANFLWMLADRIEHDAADD